MHPLPLHSSQVEHVRAGVTFELFEAEPAPWFQTFQGAVVWFSSSRCCLSLKVSMHCQNPVYL